MDLASFRKSLGLSQEECATKLGLSATSKGWISEIEAYALDTKEGRPASLKLAMKIERWSGGKVKAADICPIVDQVTEQGRAR